jgi:hypothetical protein
MARSYVAGARQLDQAMLVQHALASWIDGHGTVP